jgi:hypothetical protein
MYHKRRDPREIPSHCAKDGEILQGIHSLVHRKNKKINR